MVMGRLGQSSARAIAIGASRSTSAAAIAFSILSSGRLERIPFDCIHNRSFPRKRESSSPPERSDMRGAPDFARVQSLGPRFRGDERIEALNLTTLSIRADAGPVDHL